MLKYFSLSGCGGIGSLEHERCQRQIQRVRKGAAVEIFDFGHHKLSRGRGWQCSHAQLFNLILFYADVAELANAPDLGSGVSDVQVQVLSSAPKYGVPFWGAPCFFIQKDGRTCS